MEDLKNATSQDDWDALQVVEMVFDDWRSRLYTIALKARENIYMEERQDHARIW